MPYTMAGHSTGGRVALMLAALKDTLDEEIPYLSTVPQGEGITDEMRAVVRKIAAVVGDHEDPMNDETQNPDVAHWKITQTPTYVITGTHDHPYFEYIFEYAEPARSSWINFSHIESPTRIFINRKNKSHLAPIFSQEEGYSIAKFFKAFGGNEIS